MKKFKQIVSIIMVSVLMLSLTGCGEIEKAKKSVEEILVAFETVNMEEINTYMGDDKLTGMGMFTDDSKEQEILTLMFSKLSHKIISAEEADENTIVVKTEITTIDMAAVFQEFMQEAMKMAFDGAFSGTSLSEEEYNAKIEAKLFEILKREDIKTVTNTVDVKYVKTDGKWDVQTDDKLLDAIFGGLITFTNSFAEGLDELNTDLNTEN